MNQLNTLTARLVVWALRRYANVLWFFFRHSRANSPVSGWALVQYTNTQSTIADVRKVWGI